MKVLFLFFSMILFACGTPKNNETIDTSQTIGIVINTPDCIYIEATVDGKLVTMYPVNMEKKFKIGGTKISFNYNLSKGMQPTKCIVDKVVSVSNVNLIK